jgi:hypothetical protein
MRMAAMTAVVAVLLAGAGCGGGGGGGDGASGGRSSSAEARRRMPSCGANDAVAGELPAEAQAARDCFLAAYGAGREAELAITVISIEGDPITTIYRVLGANDVELFVDASADEFAEVKTYQQRCTAVVEDGPGLAAANCATID